MGLKFQLEGRINEISPGLYDKLSIAAKETIKTYDGDEIVGSANLAGFIDRVVTALPNDVDRNTKTTVGLILMEKSKFPSFASFLYPNLETLVMDEVAKEDIEFIKNSLGNSIGIKERQAQ
ncbi:MULTISPECIES: hypothetical protein [Bacillus cereus group]|uniref:hypothetical protein n=1 Tax=Bacillus cereus group TaxID=86661 RepID=UPI0011A74B9A|nr:MULTISPECIES: hypothetical protein [Bacillus cereus group]